MTDFICLTAKSNCIFQSEMTKDKSAHVVGLHSGAIWGIRLRAVVTVSVHFHRWTQTAS